MYRVVKRAFDIVFALVGCIGVVLLIPFVKISYLLTGDKAPIFLKNHMRIGKDGKPFRFYKFRTMVPDAERILHEELSKDPAILAEYQQNKKLKNDPRITKMGKFLRRTSLDEFPQFINVLKGDMSFVGYRPERPYYIRKIMERDSRYERLYVLRPGVTSYATLKNGYTDNIDKMLKRLEFDLYYLEHQSLWTDFKILCLTFLNIASGKIF
jgi:lipopolysaccharide/colanic/teichoic acid biosynthesis glycosyltransferase